MANYKVGRISEDIKRELTDIVRSLNDPRISDFLTIVRCEVSGDLSFCTVNVSSLKGLEDAVNTVKGLTSAKGYIKNELSARLKMRKMPDLRFIADNSIEHSAHIARVIDDLTNK